MTNTGARPDPLAVTAAGKGGNRLVAVNAAAARIGLRPGLLLTDASAIEPALKAVPQDAGEAAADLKRLATWCRRYAPWTGIDAPDGLWIDVTGAAHLVGGEDRLLEDLKRRFATAGFSARAAIASARGAAWALARFGEGALTVLPDGEELRGLAPLPVRALGIAEDAAALLDRLGLKTIGQIMEMPSTVLRARFGIELSHRLDQALGDTGESMTALPYEQTYWRRVDFAEPVTQLESVLTATSHLVQDLAERLRADGKAARRFTLTLFDTQGGCTQVKLALSRASQDAEHIVRLFQERFAALEGRFAETESFDAAALIAGRVEILQHIQSGLADTACDTHGALSDLVDRLAARLGTDAVRRFAFRDTHIPERASITVPVLSEPASSVQATAAPRPLLMLPAPEEIAVTAELPDYPPRRFIWRRVAHRVVKADGPERIAAEWWRADEENTPPRDYYRVEDEAGHRFWVYREGFYSGDMAPRWFVHGLFP